MKCPECGYISFDHLEICKKCGNQLSKHPHQNLPSTDEHEPATRESTLEYSQSESSSEEKPLGNDAEENPMGLSFISKESNEKGDNSPLSPALFQESEEDDAESCEEYSLSPEVTEGTQTKSIITDKNKSRGGFWIRTLAFIIDLIFINMIIMIFTWTIKLGIVTGARVIVMTPETFIDLREFLITIIGIAILTSYFIYFHAQTGQTPGKRLLHLKVIRTDGSPLGFNKAVERFFCYIISLLPLYVGFIMIAFNKEKQGLHDIITHTYVIKTG